VELLKELLEKDNVTSIDGYLKKKIVASQSKVDNLLVSANKAVDDAHPSHSKTLTDIASKEHEKLKKYRNKLKGVSKQGELVEEKTRWKDWLSEAKKPIADHPYHGKSDEELHYIIKDAGEAATKMKDHDSKAEAKYLDQVNDASTVLHHRKKAKK
jgi:hypothetical protein